MGRGNKRLDWNKEILTKLYWEDSKTLEEIGTIYGVTHQRIAEVMNKLEIPRSRKRTKKSSVIRREIKYKDVDELLKNYPYNRNNGYMAGIILKILPVIHCAECGIDISKLPKVKHRRFHVHHIIYPATRMKDIQILCASCHKLKHNKKITLEQQLEIYSRHSNGEYYKELAQEYKISVPTVFAIIRKLRNGQHTYRK